MRPELRSAQRTAVLGILALLPACAWAAADPKAGDDGQGPVRATIRVNAANVLHTGNRRMLIGSNFALWNASENFSTPELREWLVDMGPAVMRMPGGSWSDIIYWNGHGVRDADGNVDPTRMKDGWPAVDYSDYAPSFVVENDRTISRRDWHGHVDVKTVHEYIGDIPGCQTLVTVNAGTGRASDAAEWVRWANKKMGYNVRYWEVGNELEGSWEAGHFLPDGTELTAEMYAERYREFARAMKAVDPTIKVGGAACGAGAGGFTEVLLRDAGEHVDFVSWHTYPLRSTMSKEQMLAIAVSDPARSAEAVRTFIRKYQPEREDEIELGVTEWNLSLEGGMEVDMFGAIWTSVFVGEMLRNGVDFANQWDAFSHGGGGSLVFAQAPYARKAQYWAFWLWRHYMGDSLLECAVDGPVWLRVFATRSEDALYLMAINSSREEEVVLNAQLESFEPASQGEEAVLSHRQCFWNRLTGRAEWSTPPLVLPVDVGRWFAVSVPPSAIKCIRVPSAASPGLSERALRGRAALAQDPGPAELRIAIAPSGYDDTELGGWVRAYRAGTDDPYPVALPNARLEVSGPAETDRAEVRLAEAAGRFVLRPSEPGEAIVTATLGNQAATGKVVFTKSEPRPQVLWEFETESLGRGYRSHWELSTDDSIRANQRVARIDLPGVIPDREHRELLVISAFPTGRGLRRENIRGVFFDLLVSRDFRCNDPDARIEIIVQSPADYWMSLGSVPLPEAGDRWQTHTVMLTDPKHIKAVYAAYNVWFVLHAEKPVTGAVFMDSVGLMVR